MKKKGLILGTLLISSILTACSSNAVTESGTETGTETGTEAAGETDAEGSDSEGTGSFKIFNDGEDYSDLAYDMTREQPYDLYFYRKNGWIYGTSWDADSGKSRFQKIRDNQENRVTISPNAVTTKIEEYEGYIYSISHLTPDNSDQFGLYKTKDSGEGIQLIVPNATNFQIAGNSIYYEVSKGDDNQWLYSCDLNGSGAQKVLDEPTWYNYVYDNKVIYQGDNINVDNGEHIKIRDLESGETMMLTNRHSWSPILDGKCLYYMGAETRFDENTVQTLYKLDLKTMEEKPLKENVGGSLQYVDGWLYFQNPDDGNRLYKIDTDGNNLQMVLQDPSAAGIQVKSDGIVYLTMNKDNSAVSGYYWCQPDGTSPENLATSDSWWIQ